MAKKRHYDQNHSHSGYVEEIKKRHAKQQERQAGRQQFVKKVKQVFGRSRNTPEQARRDAKPEKKQNIKPKRDAKKQETKTAPQQKGREVGNLPSPITPANNGYVQRKRQEAAKRDFGNARQKQRTILPKSRNR